MEIKARKASLKEAVKQMRFFQKMYFKTKSPSALQSSKQWEKDVDRLLLEAEQPVLFDEAEIVRNLDSYTVRVELSTYFVAQLLQNDATALDVFTKDFIRSLKNFVDVSR